MTKCFVILLVIGIIFSNQLFAEDQVIGVGFGVNQLASQADLEIGVSKNQYLGASLSTRFQSNIYFAGSSYNGTNSNYDWTINNIDLYNFLLIPSLRFSLPFIKRRNQCWSFNMQPGVVIQLLSYDALTARCDARGKLFNGMSLWDQPLRGDFTFAKFYWQNKLYIQYRYEELGLFAGFELSNQDIYFARRSVKIDGFSLDNHLPAFSKQQNSIFIGIRLYP
jgi:hypothetical protein